MTDRRAPAPDDSGEPISTLEVEFTMPVYLTDDQQNRLQDLISEIVKAPYNQPQEGVHWVFSVGAKPRWNATDAAFLGVAADPNAAPGEEPSFDERVFHIGTMVRED